MNLFLRSRNPVKPDPLLRKAEGLVSPQPNCASMRSLFVIILLTALIFPIVALAATKTITVTHTYVMGDNDSRNDARRICFLEAKRKVLEQAN